MVEEDNGVETCQTITTNNGEIKVAIKEVISSGEGRIMGSNGVVAITMDSNGEGRIVNNNGVDRTATSSGVDRTMDSSGEDRIVSNNGADNNNKAEIEEEDGAIICLIKDKDSSKVDGGTICLIRDKDNKEDGDSSLTKDRTITIILTPTLTHISKEVKEITIKEEVKD